MPGVPDLMNAAIRRTIVICQKLAPPVWARLTAWILLDRLCFFGCEDYTDLKKAVAQYEASHKR